MRLENGFLHWAATTPDAPAVVHDGQTTTYGQLHHLAVAIADLIDVTTGRQGGDEGGAGGDEGGAGGDRPGRIGIIAERGPDAYAAVLASLLAGGAYVPMSPHHPPARIGRTIELADLDLIIADDAGLATLDALGAAGAGPPILAPSAGDGPLGVGGSGPTGSEPTGSGPTGTGRNRTTDPSGGDELAYILFTSGTTGDPKGVPITHRNATSFLAENLRHYGFEPGQRFSQTFDLTFDLSVFDLFMAFGSGGCLYPMGPTDLLDPVSFVSEHELTVWFSVPAVAAMQRQREALVPGAMPTLTTSLFCGEALPTEVATSWLAAAPNTVAENLYGPTELTIACARHRFDDEPPGDRGGLVPIGRPFPEMRAVIIDDRDQPVHRGLEGELCLDGPQRFGGYWRSPDQTADRTVRVGDRDYYRTGDIVTDDGVVMHFVGRTDHQIQVLGHRVELGEVEAALRSIDGVVDAVAHGLPYGEQTATHIGIIATVQDGSDHSERSLRRAVAPLLPVYMRPRFVRLIDRFPLNANGKIDRRTAGDAIFGPQPVVTGRSAP